MEFLTQTNIVRVPHPRVLKILEAVKLFSQKSTVSARDFLSLLGQLGAAADFVMLGLLRLRPLQMALLSQWRPHLMPLDQRIGLTTDILHHLKWWQQEDLYLQGVLLKVDHPSHTMFTDASHTGWGAHLEPEGLLYHGVWTEDQSRFHINLLEMKAISLSLTQALPSVKNATVLVATDNTTVVAYIKHQERTHFPDLCMEVWDILNMCLTHNIQLLVKHKPRRFNTLADRMSRMDKPITTEWSLMDPEPGNCKQNFQDHGIPINRSVCYPSEPQAATICATHTGSERSINRCSIDGLETHSHICVFTVPSHSTCDKQNTLISVQNQIDSASFA